MLWLYVPGLEGLNSESALPFPERAASLTSRGKPMQPQTLSRAWRTGGWITRLSGLTLEISTLDRGVGKFIASLPGIHAREILWPDSCSETQTTAGLSTRSSGSSMKAGLLVSSAKTCRGTSTDNLPPSYPLWREWGAGLRQEYSVRRKRAEATAGKGCSSWPTATANDDNKSPEAHLAMKKRMGERDGTGANRTAITSLQVMAKQWGTPSVADTMGTRERRGGARSGELLLNGQAKAWPTPATRDHKGSLPLDARDRVMGTLDEAAERKFPSAPPARPIRHGRQSLTPIPFSPLPSETSNCGTLPAEIAVYRRWSMRSGGAAGWRGTWTRKPRVSLNPRFVEWLMCWPLGWTGSGPVAMASFHWLRRSRGALSTLACAPDDQGDLFG